MCNYGNPLLHLFGLLHLLQRYKLQVCYVMLRGWFVFRNLVLVLSIASMCVVGYLVVTVNRTFSLPDLAQIFFLLGYPALVLVYIALNPPPSDEPKKVTYLDLFFERRRLEEQAKIDKLKSEAK